MISLNTTNLKQGAKIQNNVLYKIEQDRIISVREEHDHCDDVEIVQLKFDLKDGQYAVFGKEYRSPNFLKYGCKSTDVLTCLIDDKNKGIYSFLLDIKKNISAFSDDLLKDGAMLSAIKEVRDFIEQLHHALIHKESFLTAYKSYGYTETTEIGLATKSFEREKFLKVADFLANLEDYENPPNMTPLLWYKFKNNLMPYRSEESKMRNFADKRVEICGNSYDLQVYLLRWVKDSEYAASVEIKQKTKSGLDVQSFYGN